MRKKILVGNWKMNFVPSTVKPYFNEFITTANITNSSHNDLVFAVSPSLLASACEATKNTSIVISAQNIFYKKSGSYTGETSVEMIKDLGVNSTLIGHSERRTIFGESDQDVTQKTRVALENNLLAICCVGESLEHFEANETNEVIGKQIAKIFQDILDLDYSAENLVIAYEPIWAIGTGKTASPAVAQGVHKYIRGVIEKLTSKELSDKIRILYGGSMKPDNIEQLIAMPDIDGGLVGGAALKVNDFAAMHKIINTKS